MLTAAPMDGDSGDVADSNEAGQQGVGHVLVIGVALADLEGQGAAQQAPHGPGNLLNPVRLHQQR